MAREKSKGKGKKSSGPVTSDLPPQAGPIDKTRSATTSTTVSLGRGTGSATTRVACLSARSIIYFKYIFSFFLLLTYAGHAGI